MYLLYHTCLIHPNLILDFYTIANPVAIYKQVSLLPCRAVVLHL